MASSDEEMLEMSPVQFRMIATCTCNVTPSAEELNVAVQNRLPPSDVGARVMFTILQGTDSTSNFDEETMTDIDKAIQNPSAIIPIHSLFYFDEETENLTLPGLYTLIGFEMNLESVVRTNCNAEGDTDQVENTFSKPYLGFMTRDELLRMKRDFFKVLHDGVSEGMNEADAADWCICDGSGFVVDGEGKGVSVNVTYRRRRVIILRTHQSNKNERLLSLQRKIGYSSGHQPPPTELYR
ncbi:hypothetical protein M231_03333 [Tremella mesenterica]|uniref:Uncharacterized protein n=2 Tax=Tremella mesenterica TaxID=5217 RepID=A0A4Q1BNP6_TREME|nr:hypothetical protein M231_03333 [Tremella mesenterica]